MEKPEAKNRAFLLSSKITQENVKDMVLSE